MIDDSKAQYHPSKWPGANVHPGTGLAIGPVVWQEPRLHHHLGVDEHHLVRCGCGRVEQASMMRDLRHLPKGQRTAHHDGDWACTGCCSHANWLGLWYDDDHHRAVGAPAHIAELAKPHMDHIRSHRAALADRDAREKTLASAALDSDITARASVIH